MQFVSSLSVDHFAVMLVTVTKLADVVKREEIKPHYNLCEVAVMDKNTTHQSAFLKFMATTVCVNLFQNRGEKKISTL